VCRAMIVSQSFIEFSRSCVVGNAHRSERVRHDADVLVVALATVLALAPLRRSVQRKYRASLGLACSLRYAGSVLRAPFMELLRSGAELSQLEDGGACRREGERLERFGEHLVEVVPRCNARGDVRIEMLAG
jgi:hypothetical protein